jgi:hypothetical protein
MMETTPSLRVLSVHPMNFQSYFNSHAPDLSPFGELGASAHTLAKAMDMDTIPIMRWLLWPSADRRAVVHLRLLAVDGCVKAH